MPESTVSVSKWLPDVITAFRAVRGTARFPQIYRWIRQNRPTLPDHWEETIRATVYHHSSDSPAFGKGDPDVFYKKSHGLWALRFPSETLPGKTELDLFTTALLRLEPSVIVSFAGRGDELYEFLKPRIIELKQQYGIT